MAVASVVPAKWWRRRWASRSASSFLVTLGASVALGTSTSSVSSAQTGGRESPRLLASGAGGDKTDRVRRKA